MKFYLFNVVFKKDNFFHEIVFIFMLIYKVSEKDTTNGEKVLAIFNIDLHANYSIV